MTKKTNKIVVAAASGRTMVGVASEELFDASMATDSGIVWAYCSQGVWHHVTPVKRDRLVALGVEVIRVVVDGSAWSWFAAVGTDGVRPVVWGLGHTEAEALADARSNEDAGDLTVHEITAAQAEIIEAGDVSWPVAGRAEVR